MKLRNAVIVLAAAILQCGGQELGENFFSLTTSNAPPTPFLPNQSWELFDLGLINGIRSWGYYESGSDSLTGAMTDAPIAPGEGTRATRLITVLLPTGTAAAAPHTRPLRQPRAARMSFQLSIGWWKAKRQRSKP